jgi:pyrroline-5-carboxylate reductase
MAAMAEDRFPASLILAGAGKMGGAMLLAWLDRGCEARRILVVDPAPSPKILGLATERGFALDGPAAPAEVLVLAIKPQVLHEAAALEPLVGPDTLVISVLAGKTIAAIAAIFPRAGAIVRAMPNLPAAVGRGIAGLAASEAVSDEQRAMAETLLGATGRFEWLADESLIDAVTAVSGSGPAYVFYLAECLAEAGVALGLPQDVAARLARATVEGAGELLFQSRDSTPAELRESVTSRGGTTAAALGELMAPDGLAPLIQRAAKAAKARAEALSG